MIRSILGIIGGLAFIVAQFAFFGLVALALIKYAFG